MKTLLEIKNHYAQDQGFPDWEGLQSDCQHLCGEMEMHMDEICIRAQKVALEKAAENFFMDWHKSIITNPENLIR